MNEGRPPELPPPDPEDSDPPPADWSGVSFALLSAAEGIQGKRRLLRKCDFICTLTMPRMGPSLIPRADDLARGVEAETRGRDRFSTDTPRGFRKSDGAVVLYRLPSLAVIRQTDRGARRVFFTDLREPRPRSFPVMQLLMQPMWHLLPHLPKPIASAKEPMYEEIALPGKLKTYAADQESIHWRLSSGVIV